MLSCQDGLSARLLPYRPQKKGPGTSPGVSQLATSYAQEVVGARARPTPDALEARVALVGALVCTASVAMAAASASSDAAFGRGLLQLLIVGGPIAVGLYALREPANKSFGVALLAIGFLWSLTALTTSSADVPHTIGRLTTWLISPCVVWLLLAFPHGQIKQGLDRAILVGFLAVWLFLFFGTAPFVQAFPPKTLWSPCSTDCPQNALFVLDSQPEILTQVILVREWLIELLWLGLVYSMFRRWRTASPLLRRAIGSSVRGRDAARPAPVGAHHGASTRRAGRLRDRAVFSVDVVHRRRLRGVPLRPGLEADAAGPDPGWRGRRPARQR